MAKKSSKKKAKKQSKLLSIIVCALVFIVGGVLLVLSIATPAGKTYTYVDEDGEKTSLVFESEKYYTAGSEDVKFDYVVEDKMIKVVTNTPIIGEIRTDAYEFKGLTIVGAISEIEYKSTGATIMFIGGIALMVIALAGALYFVVIKKK